MEQGKLKGAIQNALDSAGVPLHETLVLARGITTLSDQLNDLMLQGLEHARDGKGMAFLEVLSPASPITIPTRTG